MPALWPLLVALGLFLLALRHPMPSATGATVCAICAAVLFLVAAILAVPGLTGA